MDLGVLRRFAPAEGQVLLCDIADAAHLVELGTGDGFLGCGAVGCSSGAQNGHGYVIKVVLLFPLLFRTVFCAVGVPEMHRAGDG